MKERIKLYMFFFEINFLILPNKILGQYNNPFFPFPYNPTIIENPTNNYTNFPGSINQPPFFNFSDYYPGNNNQLPFNFSHNFPGNMNDPPFNFSDYFPGGNLPFPFDMYNNSSTNSYPNPWIGLSPDNKQDKPNDIELRKTIDVLRKKTDELFKNSQVQIQENQEQKTEIEIQKIYLFTLIVVFGILFLIDFSILIYIICKTCNEKKIEKPLNKIVYKPSIENENMGINSNINSNKNCIVKENSDTIIEDQKRISISSTGFNILASHKKEKEINNDSNNIKENVDFNNNMKPKDFDASKIANSINSQKDNEKILTNDKIDVVDKIEDNQSINPYWNKEISRSSN